MKRISVSGMLLCLSAVIVSCNFLQAQQAAPGIAAAPAQPVSPNVISFSDTLANQPDGATTVTFALYPDQQSTTPTWTETQVVQVSQSKYTALLGSTTPEGIPPGVFAADQARWLGVAVNGTEKRYLLVSVPYAMKAMDAETLGGLTPSQYATVQQLQAALANSTAGGASSVKTASGPAASGGPVAAASSNPPQPATDFTDNNTSEVLLVTQQGTGFAIHAISAGDAALFAENSTTTGTALKAVATGTTGANIGIVGQSASSTGIAAAFDNTGGGQILSLRSNGKEVASVDNSGNFKVAQITASTFVGSGFGLTNVPNAATSATPVFVNNTIISRDQNGNFSAGQITANNFVGNGFGLTNIPNSATTATPVFINNAIVSRDQNGNFSAGQITATNFVGSGFGLMNIPNSATTATPVFMSNAIVSRDQNGNFSAGQITAANFVGSGFGLTDIPNSATTATPVFINNAIVSRDQNGNFSAGQITANNFVGNGFGLTNVPPVAIGATSSNTPNSVVQRDQNGNIFASAVAANFFSGNGGGLSGIQNSATTATNNNTPNAIVARDASGNFSAGFIQANNLSANGIVSSGLIDFSSAKTTAPVRAVLSANTPATCDANRELLIKTDATPGQQLFICNANGNGYLLVGDGTAAGVVSVGAGDSSVSVGGTAAAPTIEVADGGITGAKLAQNAVTQFNISDGSLPATKIAGTAATLSVDNVFSGNQRILGSLTANSGIISLSTITAAGAALTANSNGYLATITQKGAGGGVFATSLSTLGPTIVAENAFSGGGLSASSNGGIAVTASGSNGIGLQSSGDLAVLAFGQSTGLDAEVLGTTGTAGRFIAPAGKLLSGQVRQQTQATEMFSVDTSGNIFAGGAISAQYLNNPLNPTHPNQLAKLMGGGTAALAGIGDTTFGVVMGNPDSSGNVQVAYAGVANCLFDNIGQPLDYVVASTANAGFCSDVGKTYPSTGQVIGRLIGGDIHTNVALPVLLFGPEQHAFPGGSVGVVNTGAGLAGGPITSSGTISIANAGVTNSMLQNSAVTVNSGSGLSGGGAVPLGGSITLNNTGALSFNSRTGSILPAPGDYSFSQLNGTASVFQLPSTIVYSNQSNTFTADQTISGALTTNSLATNAISGTSASIAGGSSGTTSVVTVADNSAANNAPALSVTSQNNLAANFFSIGPNILAAGTATHNVLGVTSSGMSVVGNVSATTFSGDGSALSNVNAASVGGVSGANLATSSALNTETSARQAADTTLQNNINSEASSRQAADAVLQTSISAEVAARQTDTSNLQGSINSVSAAGAKLAAANTFTASNTFTAGTQDFSAAGATLPVRALPSAQTPASCVASKELLIKTDGTAGQQLFICDVSGTTWNLVGDGAAGGVSSFNGRNGSVSPSSNDYSFAQISGSVASGQMPALSGDITSAAGSTLTSLAPSGVSAGTYTKITVDSKGRATSGGQAGFGDIGGALSASQMPALTGDVTSAAGTATTTLAASGVTAGTYTKLTVDIKGRATGGSQAGFADLAGVATAAQLPGSVVYNNQANTFSGNQGVNGTLTATLFSGNGSGLSNVNAATVGGIAPGSFALLSANDSFTGNITAAGFSGNGSGLTNVNAATVNNFQMLKLTASLTPTNVNAQTCNEQTFAVTGVNIGDVLLTVQLATHNPGTNIALGGWRVPAANTVAIQFCNVSRNNSTPAPGTYTLALMR